MEYSDVFAGRDPNTLTLLELQLTYTCNIRCSYCFNPHHRRGDELATDEWKRVISEAAAMGARVCVVNGGEPLGRSDCVDVLAHASSAGLATAISTNGMLLNEETVRRFASFLSVLQISIHPWRYIDDLAAGVESFARHIRAFKEQGGRKAVFNIVLYKGGLLPKLEELLHIIDKAAGKDLEAVGVQPANPYGHGFLNPASIPSMEECEKAAEIIDRCGRVLGVTIKDHVSDYFMVKRNTWGTYGLIVNPEGYVYPMIEGSDMLAFVFKELNFDNVRSSALAAIWKDSPILGRYRGTEWLREPCTSCPVRDECRGGSRLNSFILTREFEGADPFCVLSPDHGKVLRFYKNNDVNVLQPAPALPA